MNKSPQRVKLIKLRHTFKFTQQEFATFLGVKQASYARYESGVRYPAKKTAERLKKFCKKRGLKITLDDLIA